MTKVVAILSTTIIPLDGVYEVQTLPVQEPGETSLAGIPNYVGHPATKAIVEALGAIPAPSKLFSGLEVGECALCVSIKQGRSDRSQGGTAVNQEVTIDDLDFRLLTRL